MDTIPQRVTEAPVEGVPIDQIRVGVRRRQALGPLEALCRSIVARGLIHPILIRGDGVLVSGARRLEACRRLRWTTIPARRVDSLTDEELRAAARSRAIDRRSGPPTRCVV
jgi:ParB-like chromosome segregation protein Spo0J